MNQIKPNQWFNSILKTSFYPKPSSFFFAKPVLTCLEPVYNTSKENSNTKLKSEHSLTEYLGNVEAFLRVWKMKQLPYNFKYLGTGWIMLYISCSCFCYIDEF
jgi:hypothetical protein